MPTSYQWLTQATGLGVAAINLTYPNGTGHAQIEMMFKDSHVPIIAINSANLVRSTFVTRILPFLSSQYLLQQVSYTVWDSATIQQAVTAHAPNAGGVGGGAAWPPQLALIVRKNTGFVGRQNRGRFYLPGLPNSSLQDPSNMDPTTLASFNVAVTNWFTDLSSGNMSPWLIRKTENPSLNHNIGISQLIGEQLLGTQRRRQRKVAHR